MDDIPPRSYGRLIETTVRITTWNVWGLYGVPAQEDGAALSGVAVMSRWPIRRESSLAFGSARVQFAELSGPRGLIQVYGLVMDAWWFDESQSRQDAVRELLSYVHQAQDTQAPLIICGDFNADPGSDEIRMLTGLLAGSITSFPPPPRPGGAGPPLGTALLGTHPVKQHLPLRPLRPAIQPPLLITSAAAPDG